MATSTFTTQDCFPSIKQYVQVNGVAGDPSKLTFTNASNLAVQKRGRKPKTDKVATADPCTSDFDGPAGPVACRYENSLGLLTKKFVDLVRQSEDGMVDLNTIATTIQVRKRRLYDITNVLEGIGLLEKVSTSVMHWRGFDSESDELANQASILQDELETLSSQEAQFDESIREKQQLLEALWENESNKKHLFLSATDIMSLPDLKSKTVFAIKAPRGSSFQVPDPDKDSYYSEKQHRIMVKSAMGPIDVHFLSKTEGKSTNFASVSGSACEDENERGVSSHHFQGVRCVDRQVSTEQDSYEIHKLTPYDFYSDRPEEDYWLKSDIEVSLTDLWAS